MKMFSLNRPIKNPSFVKSNYLAYYWPFNGHLLTDTNNKSYLFDGQNSKFINDKNDKLHYAAIGLYEGYFKVKDDFYFNANEFSVMAWVKVRSYKYSQRLIDFGNGPGDDNVLCTISYQNTSYPSLAVWQGGVRMAKDAISNQSLELGIWTHLACVLSSNGKAQIFINGYQKAEEASLSPIYVHLYNNFVGRSNWFGYLDQNDVMSNDQDADVDIDELKIFNKGLTANEIQFEMNNNIYI